MFVFFDRNGVVREIINDKAVRQANVKANRIYCYFDEVEPYDVFKVIQWGDLSIGLETSFYENQVEMTVPYNKDRDYKYFKDFKTYKFFYFDLDDIKSDGLATATIRIMEDEDSLFAQGNLIFNVENSVIKNDEYITQSQYDYLVSLVARNNLEIERIKYNATVVKPLSVNTVFEPYLVGEDILKIHARPNFNVAGMTKFINDNYVENMFYGCGADVLSNGEALESAGFELNYNNAQIGKLQLQINSNFYGGSFELKCYVTSNGEEELVDKITIPKMEKGVFSFFRFDVYRTNVTKIKVVQEDGWLRDRFYVKSVEPFSLTGKGYYEITQKNGIVSKIDNPDENYLDTVYQYVLDQMVYINGVVPIVEDSAEYVKEAYEFIVPAYEEIKVANDNFERAEETLNEINNKLNQPLGFAQLGADGKIQASQMPLERLVNVFAIQSVNDLTNLADANVGDIAYIIQDGKATHNYRLVADPYTNIDNWILQSTTFTSNSAYAERCGLADNSTMVNGIAFQRITLEDYNKLSDKSKGTYLVTLE